ncbi:S-adenosylmethionine:tRNA ribosyltransferase-isomerase [Shouchella shacheensis]|uniref:S-adenosylmethionine:tRNA ribosyltransferase-isomerase n=1 Tax=Shouchella shacheensis TaxID=1649580 RepID=UPI00073FB1B4|nr:S-adenosylmethionine:tRNA ribosyltransferase-isomerase [Shouchella shacheensis]
MTEPLFTAAPLDASAPPEERGHTREDVRLLTYDTESYTISHGRFPQIGEQLECGDVLVLNNSRTIPAVLKSLDGVEIRLSRQVAEDCWDVLFPAGPPSDAILQFAGGLSARRLGAGSEPPLSRVRFSRSGTRFLHYLYSYADTIRYEHVAKPWPLESYQTVFASAPGSVEMPSAGRAFTWRLLRKLEEKGIQLAFITLHAGLSYYEDDQWPTPALHPEAFHVPPETAQLIQRAKKAGRRVVAVGTTVVRALESAVRTNGRIEGHTGLTSLYIHKDYPLSVADGLLTGFHEAEASHIDLLQAFIRESDLPLLYQEAMQRQYLWHEFGDMNLLLPGSP